jgi:uncharacterized coiled-coil protein SlyX
MARRPTGRPSTSRAPPASPAGGEIGGARLYWRPARTGATVSQNPRIETLEIKIAHLERALQDLSDALYRQQQRLDAQEERYQRLIDRVEGANQQSGSGPKFEIPPHY